MIKIIKYFKINISYNKNKILKILYILKFYSSLSFIYLFIYLLFYFFTYLFSLI